MFESDIFPEKRATQVDERTPNEQSRTQNSRIIAVTSGKGGVGKTSVATNLALALAAYGDHVTIVDADFALANIDVLFGLSPQHHIGHVIFGEKQIDEIIMNGPRGIKIIPASSGIQELADMNSIQRRGLIRSLQQYSRDTDWLLIDTAAGISVNVTQLVGMAHEAIVVTTPEPTAIVDAYAIIKVITAERFSTPINILVNKASGPEEAEDVANQIRNVTNQFLSRDVDYLGYISRDPLVSKAVMRQEPVSLSYPEAPASLCFDQIANQLRGDAALSKAGNVIPFWRNVLRINTPKQEHQ
ncbi:MAG TPA: MinD/ParA family protein [Blastocatellia bacterium]|nr:MinD/ParA family protein [Blastocatellia bacterium]